MILYVELNLLLEFSIQLFWSGVFHLKENRVTAYKQVQGIATGLLKGGLRQPYFVNVTLLHTHAGYADQCQVPSFPVIRSFYVRWAFRSMNRTELL